jgi:hypothetical protein
MDNFRAKTQSTAKNAKEDKNGWVRGLASPSRRSPPGTKQLLSYARLDDIRLALLIDLAFSAFLAVLCAFA